LSLSILEQVTSGAGNSPALDAVMVFTAAYSPYILALLLIVYFLFGKDRDKISSTTAAFSGVFALLLNQIIGLLYYSPRPFLLYSVNLLLPPNTDTSFPSDHTALAFAVALTILIGNKKLGTLLVLFSFLIGISRVYSGEHYPLDILGGMATGAVSALLIPRVMEREGAVQPVLALYKRLAKKAKQVSFPPRYPGHGGTLKIFMLFAAAVLIYIYWEEFLPLLKGALKYIQEAKLRYVLLALSLYILSVFLFAARWKIVLSTLGYNIKTTSLVPILFGAISINNLTPANRMGGEPLRALWIKKQFGVRFSHAIISIVYERAVEAIPVAILAAYAIYSQLPLFDGHLLKITLYLAITLLLLAAGCYVIKSKLSGVIRSLRGYSERLNRAFTPTLLFSSLVWVQDILRLKLVTLALGLHVAINVIVVISVLYLVLGSVPLTPGGLGIVDGGLVSALALFNVPLDAAIGVVAIERFISYGISSLIGAVCLIYFGGLNVWRNTESQW